MQNNDNFQISGGLVSNLLSFLNNMPHGRVRDIFDAFEKEIAPQMLARQQAAKEQAKAQKDSEESK